MLSAIKEQEKNANTPDIQNGSVDTGLPATANGVKGAGEGPCERRKLCLRHFLLVHSSNNINKLEEAAFDLLQFVFRSHVPHVP